MPVLKPTDFRGEIVFLGCVQDQSSTLASTPFDRVFAGFAGVEGDVHAGLTRPSCSRVVAQYPKGTTIRNTRQLSILGAEDLEEIARRMGLDMLAPQLLGATMVIRGIPDFSHLPPGSRLQAESGATLVVDLENRPCVLPSKGIEAAHPGFGARFKPAAKGRRGIVAWVEREGPLHVGDAVRLHVPDQRIWSHLDQALESGGRAE